MHSKGPKHFSDIVDTSALQSMMERLYVAAGLPVAIIEPDGNIVIATGWQSACTHFHRVHPETNRLCLESDAFIKSQLGAGSRFVEYKCKNGLWDIAIPLLIEGAHVATLFVGQFFYDDEKVDIDFFKKQAEQYSFEKREFLTAIDKVPRFSRKKVREMVDFYLEFVDFIVKIGISRIKLIDAEKNLKKSRDYYVSLFENVPFALFHLDAERIQIQVNEFAADMFGYPKEELLGKTTESLYPSEREYVEFGEYCYSAILRDGLVSREIQLKRKNGEVFWCRLRGVRISPRQDERIHAYHSLWIIEDIENQRKFERDMSLVKSQLIHTSKLASIGTMAAGVAHEINNPLTIIQGYAGMIKEELSKYENPAELQVYVGKQLKAVERISKIVSGLKNFSRSDGTEVRVHDLVGIVTETLEFYAPLFKKKKISIQFVAPNVPCPIRCNSGHVQQIVLNLLTNSRDAFKEVTDRAPCINIDIQPGPLVRLKIRDNGCGIDKENLEHIFEPFFTTKEKNEGTGLGLSITSSIIKEMDGNIEVESELDVGTCFTLLLPKAQTAEEMIDEVPHPKLSGKILIVDDEQSIRGILFSYLTSLGFEVDEADDGDVALQKINGSEYDFVITDWFMPRMSGSQLLLEIRKLSQKKTKVIVLSGIYAENLSLDHQEIIKNYAQAHLRKPVSSRAIYDALIQCAR